MEEGFEQFEVSDWDLKNEFNTERFNSKKTSKKQAIYGVFGSDSDDDQEEKKSKKNKKDISFVSSDSKPSTSTSSSKPNRTFKQSDRFAGVASSSRLGQWEKYTTGIGSKLLGKMGWDPGKGLGKNLQGIAVPIEASVRPSGVGIGAAGKEKKQTAIFSSNVEAVDVEPGSSRETNESKSKKRYVYKSVDELMEDDNEDENVISLNTKVIDMRGPELKVTTGYKETFTTKTMPSGPAAEVELSIMAVEKDLIKVTREIKRNKDRIERIEDDRLFIEVETKKESQELDKLIEAAQMVRSLKVKRVIDDPGAVIYSILDTYRNLFKAFPEDIERLKFRPLIQNTLKQLCDQLFKEWSPFDANQEDTMSVIRQMKQTLAASHDNKMYQVLVWKSWMPRFRRTFLDFQGLKNPDTVISNLESWSPFIPDWMMSNLIHQLILPRLLTEVEEWDPLSDVVPVHTWIHPWLLLIDSKDMESIYRTILRKFGRAISSWDPSDASAKIILFPWKDTIPTPAWNSFMTTHITPKLEASLGTLIINPGNQRLDQWTWVMNWQGMLPDAVIAGMLTKHFFPRWLKVLYDWLSAPSVDFEEVSNWYLGWKNLIPEGVVSDNTLQDFLNRGLEMMDFAVSSPFGMSAYVYRPPGQAPLPQDNSMIRERILAATSTSDTINFKELVARKAQERGLLFMPISSKTLDGKQIYAFGSHHIYIDRSVIFALNPVTNHWTPVLLDSLC